MHSFCVVRYQLTHGLVLVHGPGVGNHWSISYSSWVLMWINWRFEDLLQCNISHAWHSLPDHQCRADEQTQTCSIFHIFHLHHLCVDPSSEHIQGPVDGLGPLGGLLSRNPRKWHRAVVTLSREKHPLVPVQEERRRSVFVTNTSSFTGSGMCWCRPVWWVQNLSLQRQLSPTVFTEVHKLFFKCVLAWRSCSWSVIILWNSAFLTWTFFYSKPSGCQTGRRHVPEYCLPRFWGDFHGAVTLSRYLSGWFPEK